MSRVIHLGNENEFDTIINGSDVVLVDFYAKWCRPCQMLGPVLDELSLEVDYKVVKIDVDEFPSLAGKFNVASIPTLLVFKNGELVKTNMGFMSKEAINSFVLG